MSNVDAGKMKEFIYAGKVTSTTDDPFFDQIEKPASGSMRRNFLQSMSDDSEDDRNEEEIRDFATDEGNREYMETISFEFNQKEDDGIFALSDDDDDDDDDNDNGKGHQSNNISSPADDPDTDFLNFNFDDDDAVKMDMDMNPFGKEDIKQYADNQKNPFEDVIADDDPFTNQVDMMNEEDKTSDDDAPNEKKDDKNFTISFDDDDDDEVEDGQYSKNHSVITEKRNNINRHFEADKDGSLRSVDNYSPFQDLGEEKEERLARGQTPTSLRQYQNYSPFDALEEEDYQLPKHDEHGNTAEQSHHSNKDNNNATNHAAIDETEFTLSADEDDVHEDEDVLENGHENDPFEEADTKQEVELEDEKDGFTLSFNDEGDDESNKIEETYHHDEDEIEESVGEREISTVTDEIPFEKAERKQEADLEDERDEFTLSFDDEGDDESNKVESTPLVESEVNYDNDVPDSSHNLDDNLFRETIDEPSKEPPEDGNDTGSGSNREFSNTNDVLNDSTISFDPNEMEDLGYKAKSTGEDPIVEDLVESFNSIRSYELDQKGVDGALKKQTDSLEELLNKSQEKARIADLHTSFNAVRLEEADYPDSPSVVETNSSLSSTSSHFDMKEAVISNDNPNFDMQEAIISTDNHVYQNEISYSRYPLPLNKHGSPNFGGNRLYSQGIQNQRKKAISKRNDTQKKLKSEHKLDLATRSYTLRKQSSSSSRAQSRSSIRSTTTGEVSVYSKMYSIAKEKEEEAKKNNFKSPSPARSRSSALKNPRKKDNDDSSMTAVQSVIRTSSRTRARNNNGMTANERLYNLAKKKRLLEMERERERKTREDKQLSKSRLNLATRKSNGSSSSSSSGSNIHNKLYFLAKVKRDERQKMMQEARDEKEKKLPKQMVTRTKSEREANQGFARLYSKSMKKNNEGRKLREAIAQKKAPRAPTPTRTIKAEEAANIYNRGMVQKMHLEIKREEGGLMTNYVSPLLNPLVELEEGETSPVRSPSVNRASSRSRSTSVNRTSSGRIRSRSRLREFTSTTKETAFARSSTPTPLRNQTPISSRRNPTPTRLSYDQSPMSKRSSTPTSRSSRSYTRVTPNTRNRSPTPSRIRQNTTPVRRQKQDMTRQLLRKLETDMHSSMKNVQDFKKDTDTSIRTASTKGTSCSDATTPPTAEYKQRPASPMFLTHARSDDYPFSY